MKRLTKIDDRMSKDCKIIETTLLAFNGSRAEQYSVRTIKGRDIQKLVLLLHVSLYGRLRVRRVLTPSEIPKI